MSRPTCFFPRDKFHVGTGIGELSEALNRIYLMDDPRVEQRRRLREKYGPDLIELLLEAVPALPEEWVKRTPDHGFEYLRCKLRFGQEELGRKTGMTQARVSRIEGGADVRVSVWRKLYAAMGFDLVLLPVSRLTVEELEDLAARGRPHNHWLYERSRPRRRWRREQAEAARVRTGSPQAQP